MYTAVRNDTDARAKGYTSMLESNVRFVNTQYDNGGNGGPGTDVVIARISPDGFTFKAGGRASSI